MNQTTQMQTVNRLYKSRIFAMLYSDRKDLLDLYNAVSGKHYEDPELLEISPPTVPTCPAVFVLYLGSVFRDDKR